MSSPRHASVRRWPGRWGSRDRANPTRCWTGRVVERATVEDGAVLAAQNGEDSIIRDGVDEIAADGRAGENGIVARDMLPPEDCAIGGFERDQFAVADRADEHIVQCDDRSQ